jgi:Ni/Co efflux regulator RcnB
MPLSRRPICLLLVAVLAGAGATAWAGPQARLDTLMKQAQARDEANKRGERPQPQHDRAGDQRALSDAVRRAERATRGQVLSAVRVQYDGRDLNRVKVVDDRGRVRVYWDDPQAQPAEGKDDEPRSRRTRDDDDDSD